MYSSCPACGSEMTSSNGGSKVAETEKSVRLLVDGEHRLFCTFCGANQEHETVEDGSLSPSRPPLISPAVSHRSTDSSISSCSDCSVEVNSYNGGTQDDLTCKVNEKLHKQSTVFESNLDTSSKNMYPIKRLEEITEVGVERTDGSFKRESPIQIYEEIWDPPEAEDSEDDMEGSVPNYDDDDECVDGINWSKPSALSSFGGEGSGSYKVKEEREKAIEEVINGKFKILVRQLLNSFGLDSSDKDSECWVDIVTNLSWKAASFLNPEAIDGKAMDPDGYVKVKCIQTGSRCESELINGMVFKKHAAHKRMPTTYKNPRLLLIRGMLGQSSSGLSSFVSMDQETEYMKSLIEMIETCHPDVILVEKSVSRDIQESILAKGMTLVFDMKLHRLERIARCTGSPIISSDSLMNPKLKHCDSFHIEKFVEELAVSEGGKAPSKTLMFLEGCPTRLGCTILLKGSHSNELKKVKCVVQCTVVMAYQFILESSFLVDQKAMFETITGSSNSSVSSMEESTENFAPLDTGATIDIPITNGFHEGEVPFSYEPYNPAVLSGLSFLSNSVSKAIGDRFTLLSSAIDPSLSCYFGLKGNVNDGHCDMEVTGSSDEEKSDHHGRSESLPIDCEDDSDVGKPEGHDKNQVQSSKAGIDKLLDSQSILVLMSSRNASTGTICEQSHFSHIKFYKNFDIPLGKFLRENILNQSKKCSTCGKLPESHLYYYVHHNKQLTVQVKRLHEKMCLPGETKGKLWMWSRCRKCNSMNRTSHSTKRLSISPTARSLSFGKFLELSFSHNSSLFTGCGHSIREDFLHFFGLGPMVTMFSYSPVATYTVSLPPQKLEFNFPMKPELYHKETQDVLNKGNLLFTEVSNSLKKLGSKFKGSTLRLHGSLKEFSDIETMLKQERSKFEVKLENAAVMSVNPDVYKLLRLNRLRWELLLQSCIWDRRLNSLRALVHTITNGVSTNKTVDKTNDDLLNDNIHVLDSADQNIEIEKTSIEIEEDHSVVAEDVQIELALEKPDSDVTSVSEQDVPIISEPGDSDSVNSEELTVDDSNREGWVWAPFSELQERGMKHLQGSMFPLFESINSHIQDQLPSVYQLVAEEGSRLHIPLGTDDYIVSDYEGELSSIIACALTALIDRPSPVDHHDEDSHAMSRIASMTSLQWPSSTSSSDNSNGLISKSVSLDESRFSSFDGRNLFDSLVSSAARHPEVSLGATKLHGKCKYSVVCVYAEEFRNLRNKCCPSNRDYIASLSRCKNWDAKGGKSKAVFAKTLDNRFIIKEIKKTEFESFLKFAPEYFTYMNQSFTNGNQTCLAKILGIYQVVIRLPKNGKEVKHDLMVMENLSFGRTISRQYDLKGALHARLNLTGDGSDDVLLDQNFVNDTDASPLYVSNTAKHHLQRAIWNDTTFLNSINVMDYSLLVGVDTDGHELVCGIIDYLRQYTWDKQLETWVKSSLVVPKNVLPTVISPKEYKKRFRKFMSAHFLSVPDNWCRQISYEEEEDSSESKTRTQ